MTQYAKVVQCFDALHWTRSFSESRICRHKTRSFSGWLSSLAKALGLTGLIFRGSSLLLVLVWCSQYSKYSVPLASLRSFTSDQHIFDNFHHSLSIQNWLNSSARPCWLQPWHSIRFPVCYSREERLITLSLLLASAANGLFPLPSFFRGLQQASSTFLVHSNSRSSVMLF